MPNYEYSPNIAISARFDARAWGDGVTLFTRNGISVTGSASLAIVHDDALAFLNNHGIDSDLADYLNGAIGPGFTAGIDENDRVYIEHATTDFQLNASSGNLIWGFPLAGTGLVGGGAPYRHTASANWVRGNTYDPTAGTYAQLVVEQGFSTVSWPPQGGTIQDVPVSLRDRGSVGDLDDSTNDCLSDRATLIVGGEETYWGITDDGYVYAEVDADDYATPALSEINWVDTDLRDRLGFDGTESAVAYGADRYRQVANNPLPGFITPDRPLVRLDIGTEHKGSSIQKINGAHYAVPVNTYQTVEFTWHLDGPSDRIDLHRHWEEYVVPYLNEGMPFNLYQDWGDSRRAGVPRRGNTYGLLYTTEFNGYRGRLPLYVRNGTDGTLAWPDALRIRMPITIRAWLRD